MSPPLLTRAQLAFFALCSKTKQRLLIKEEELLLVQLCRERLEVPVSNLVVILNFLRSLGNCHLNVSNTSEPKAGRMTLN